ncbi:MAG: L-threonylcarbamoyladenylate synthase [Patescibacteria group bacterium]
MTHIEINPKRTNPAVVDLIAGSLHIGQIIVLPTDTIYGLSCLADNVRAIKKIYHLKERDAKKPMSILVSSLEMAKKYVLISDKQGKMLKKIWSKNQVPTTVILKNKFKLPSELTRNVEGLAVRLPKSKFLIKILEKVDCPLVSTSLNLSGQKEIKNLSKLNLTFPKKNNRPDLVVDAGSSPQTKASRLINLMDEDNPIVIRK